MSAAGRRFLILVLCLAAAAVLIVGAAALGPEPYQKPPSAPVARVRVAIPATPSPPTSPSTSIARPPVVPSGFWTDYVLVDSVVDGHTLVVHSTRQQGRPQYTLATDENTILNPPDGIFGPAPGIRAGSWFYFTGVVEEGVAPLPTRVRVSRLFQFASPPDGLAPPGVK
jgi:hypothetical protein